MFLILFFFFNLSSAICPNGTIEVPNNIGSAWNCTSFNKIKKSFIMAESECRASGGHLVSISNGFVNSYISSWFQIVLSNINFEILQQMRNHLSEMGFLIRTWYFGSESKTSMGLDGTMSTTIRPRVSSNGLVENPRIR